MEQLLQELIGKRVLLYSVRGETEVSDGGVLLSFDNQWIKIQQEQVVLYFSVCRVRLVKPQ